MRSYFMFSSHIGSERVKREIHLRVRDGPRVHVRRLVRADDAVRFERSVEPHVVRLAQHSRAISAVLVSGGAARRRAGHCCASASDQRQGQRYCTVFLLRLVMPSVHSYVQYRIYRNSPIIRSSIREQTPWRQLGNPLLVHTRNIYAITIEHPLEYTITSLRWRSIACTSRDAQILCNQQSLHYRRAQVALLRVSNCQRVPVWSSYTAPAASVVPVVWPLNNQFSCRPRSRRSPHHINNNNSCNRYPSRASWAVPRRQAVWAARDSRSGCVRVPLRRPHSRMRSCAQPARSLCNRKQRVRLIRFRQNTAPRSPGRPAPRCRSRPLRASCSPRPRAHHRPTPSTHHASTSSVLTDGRTNSIINSVRPLDENTDLRWWFLSRSFLKFGSSR